MNFYRIYSIYETNGFNKVKKWSNSERRDYKLIKESAYSKKLSKTLEPLDLVRFGDGFLFFSIKAVSIIKNINPRIEYYPVEFIFENQSITYFYIESVNRKIRLSNIETPYYFDLNNVYLDPISLADHEIISIDGSSEIILSENTKASLISNSVTGFLFEEIEITNLDSSGLPFSFYQLTYSNVSKYLWIQPQSDRYFIEENNHKLARDYSEFTRYSGTTFSDLIGSTLATNFYSERFLTLIKSICRNNFSTRKVVVSHKTETRAYYQVLPEVLLEAANEPFDGISIYNCFRYSPKFFRVSDMKLDFPVGVESTGYMLISNKEKAIIENSKFSNIEFMKLKLVKKPNI